MSLTEKTDTRDSDEKVVEFLPDCNKFLHMILITKTSHTDTMC